MIGFISDEKRKRREKESRHFKSYYREFLRFVDRLREEV